MRPLHKASYDGIFQATEVLGAILPPNSGHWVVLGGIFGILTHLSCGYRFSNAIKREELGPFAYV